jgi:uncharacterized protein YjiK
MWNPIPFALLSIIALFMSEVSAGIFPETIPDQDEVKGDVVGIIPLREVSGLAIRTRGAVQEILAIGDHDFELAVGKLKGGAVAKFDVVDLGKALRDAHIETQEASQWEGIKCDASGRMFVLEENPGHIFVFNSAGEKLLINIELDFHTDDSDLAELQKDWEMDPNSRGEGLAFLENGHFLVLKEKKPRRLIEFGPRGEASVGLRPLKIGKKFPFPADKSARMVPLAAWKFSHESEPDFPDLSDLDVDNKGGLWVLTDEGRAIGMVTGKDIDERLGIGSITKLSDKRDLEKPEGLILLGPAAALVACDKPDRDTSLYSIKLNRNAR